MKKNTLNQPGQVALIMVLIMTVVSAVAVSVASRSTVETRIQQMNIDNTQAILTAQAGLESAITKDSEVSGSLGTGKDYAVIVADNGSSAMTTEKTGVGETIEVNMVGASGVTGVKVYWKPAVAGEKPGIIVSELRSNKGIDFAYDPEGAGSFTQVLAGGSLSGISYSYVTPTIPVISGTTLKLRITVLGYDALLGIEPVGGILPAQTRDYKSVADLTSGETKLKYGVEYVESKVDQLPSIYDYVMFSGGAIIQ